MNNQDWTVVQNPDCGPDKHRSYHRDVTRFLSPFTQVRIFGTNKYPMYYVPLGRGPKHVLVTGGVHGEEPAGIYAALDLIQQLQESKLYERDFTIHVYPCMNPWGYEHDTRENGENLDLNRGFKDEIVAVECREFANHLKKLGILHYEFTIDFHESSRNIVWKNFTIEDNPDGAWLWEMCHRPNRRMGREMIEALNKSGLPVNTLEKVWDDYCHYGLISYPEDMNSADYATLDSFDAFLWKNYTRNAFTSETNMDWIMEDRIKAHHLLFFAALDSISK